MEDISNIRRDKYFILYRRKNNHVISKLLYNIIILIQFYSRNYNKQMSKSLKDNRSNQNPKSRNSKFNMQNLSKT